MSKQLKTLSAISTSIVSWSNAVDTASVERKALLAKCDTLTLPEKQRIDVELVNYFAAKASVDVKGRERAHAFYCTSVPCWPVSEDGKAKHPAMMALSRCRSVLFAAELGKKPAKAGAKTQEKKAPKINFDTLLPSIGALIESCGDGKITAAQKRDVRQAATLLLGLIGK